MGEGKGGGDIRAAGAGYRNGALLLRVDVDHLAACQHAHVQLHRAQHTDLLVGGEHRFDRRMSIAVTFQNGKNHRHGDAVVCAQRGAAGFDKVVVYIHINSVFFKVDGAAVHLLAHHIEMPLQNDGRGVFVSGGAVFEQDHIVRFVADAPQMVLACERFAKRGDPVAVAGAARNSAELFKIMKYARWLQLFQLGHDHSS